MAVQFIGLSDPLWPQALPALRQALYPLPEYVYLDSIQVFSKKTSRRTYA